MTFEEMAQRISSAWLGYTKAMAGPAKAFAEVYNSAVMGMAIVLGNVLTQYGRQVPTPPSRDSEGRLLPSDDDLPPVHSSPIVNRVITAFYDDGRHEPLPFSDSNE